MSRTSSTGREGSSTKPAAKEMRSLRPMAAAMRKEMGCSVVRRALAERESACGLLEWFDIKKGSYRGVGGYSIRRRVFGDG